MIELFSNNSLKKMIRDMQKAQNDIFSTSFELSFYGDAGGLNFPKKDDANYEYTEEVKETDSIITTVETWKEKNGSTSFTRTSVKSKKKEESAQEIKEQIKAAVAREDYEAAAQLKKKLAKS